MEEPGKTPELLGGFSPGDISEAIAKLREHPEIISAVSSALAGSVSSHKESEISDTNTSPDVPVAASSATAIPMEKITQVMANIGPMLSELSRGATFEKEITGSREEHRYALLCALRPYLSRERREMVDYILKFGKIGELLKKMK